MLLYISSEPLLTTCCVYSRDADFKLNRNPFVETALAYALSYVYNLTGANLGAASITILADNSYYSTNEDPTTSAASGKSDRFHNFRVPLPQAHKTGLGSSAALVTAFTAAVLTYYLPTTTFNLSTEKDKRKLHNLAQAAHCAAQGKVGSGFDVASAVYGSCLYRRFSPDILAHHGEPGSFGFGKKLRELVQESETVWDTEIRKKEVRIPQGVRLVMCDVSCGSQTPGMVKKMLKWRAGEGERAERVWRELHEANGKVVEDLREWAEVVARGGGVKEGVSLEEVLARDLRGIRALVKRLSEESGVAVEPPSQTKLLDACERIEGVIGGVVPGAGGYDAIALLIKDDDTVVAGLQKLFAGWKFSNDQGESEGRVSMLGVREEMDGVELEDVKGYEQWLEKP